MITALGWLLQTANYSKLMKVGGECQQTMAKKKIRVTSKRSSGSSLMVYVGVSQRLIVEDSIKKQNSVYYILSVYV
jgi:hypothetical protein